MQHSYNATVRGGLVWQRYWASEPTRSRWITLIHQHVSSLDGSTKKPKKNRTIVARSLCGRTFWFRRIPPGLKYHINMTQTLVRSIRKWVHRRILSHANKPTRNVEAIEIWPHKAAHQNLQTNECGPGHGSKLGCIWRGKISAHQYWLVIKCN